jgi:ribosome-binding ATPase
MWKINLLNSNFHKISHFVFKKNINNILNFSQKQGGPKKYFSVSVALVGYPNVGKSTFFNALVKRQLAEARNLPFCTIEPNIAKVEAVDERLIELSKITNNSNIKAYKIEVMDVAGLIKGSMSPDGAGVQFLHCLRQATAIIQVLRCFKNPDITYMDDKLNPLNEMDVVQTELILSDIDVIDRRIAKGGKKTTSEEKDFLEKIKKELNSGKSVRNLNFKYTEKEKQILDSLNLISRKPFVYVFNVDPPEIENDLTKECEALLGTEDRVVTSVLLENEALQLAEDAPIIQSLETINEYFATFPNFKFQSWNLIEKIVKKLDYVTFYSVGETNINQSWLLKKGCNIIDAANAIHSDLAKHFICAEITTVDDWRKYKTEENIKTFSKIRTVSRDYVVQDGDIVNIKSRK